MALKKSYQKANQFEEKTIELVDTDLTSAFKIINNKNHNLNPSVHVKVKTLNKVLEESNSPKEIDFFCLDVEGAEYMVLEGINFKKYTFKYLLIETKNFDKINKYLIDNNYMFLENLSHHDYLFSKN